MTAYRLVPVEPSEEMWGGIARDIVMWMRMTAGERGTGASLHQHLRSIRGPVPDWLTAEIPDTDRVPPKGTVAVAIYKAMLASAPVPQNELLEAADLSPIERLAATTDYMDAFRRGQTVEGHRSVEKLALWMIKNSFPTGHGDTLDDLLGELFLQVKELRRSAEQGDEG